MKKVFIGSEFEIEEKVAEFIGEKEFDRFSILYSDTIESCGRLALFIIIEII